jgi:hypothetical protein
MSTGKRGDLRNSNHFRAQVREMLAKGYSAARIAKETGKSYQHTQRIVAQEKQEQPA